MNIILVSSIRQRGFRLVFGPVGVCMLAGLFTALVIGAYQLGVKQANEDALAVLASARDTTRSVWETELADQQASLENLRLGTEKSLDAMAGRLSVLQGYIMRLDALGSRLATMANLDDIEFGVENLPGMGGPAPDLGEDREMAVADILSTFDELEYVLQDRTEKLSAMESMLINRTLQEQTAPGGKPALGGYLSSLFGYRTDPMSGKKEFHEGLDFAGKKGSPVVAVAAGIVTWSGPHLGYGNLVEVNHGNGYITRYAHNNRNLVTVGEKVERGEVIATMGSTGRSTGTHVHFEVIYNGRHVDPRKYLSLK